MVFHLFLNEKPFRFGEIIANFFPTIYSIAFSPSTPSNTQITCILDNLIWSNMAVPNIFGTRDSFHGRQFFHRLRWEEWLQYDWKHYTYCALYFCYYYVSTTANHLALDLEIGDPPEAKALLFLSNIFSFQFHLTFLLVQFIVKLFSRFFYFRNYNFKF